ncbi:MAG: hypothetical protein VX944_10465 [Myxococcota bacterium]|nr:hypothetical protein [Myxococcota bacterium]
MRIALLLALGMAGCADESNMAMRGAGDAAAEFAMDTGGAEDGGAPDVQEEPSHWVLSGTLDVARGEVMTTLSHVDVVIKGASGSTLCVDGLGVESSERIPELPDSDLQIWWSVSLADATADSCLADAIPGVVPVDLHLGLGPLHPEIRAVMGDELSSLGGDQIVLRSVFASLRDADPVWVFGVAGGEPNGGSSVDASPSGGVTVLDGQWKFQGVYAFPY